MITLKMADQGKSHFCVVFTTSLYALELKQRSISFLILSHMALMLTIQAVQSYLKQSCKLELHNVPNTKVNTAKDHSENYMDVKPSLVSDLFHSLLFCCHACTLPWLTATILHAFLQKQEPSGHLTLASNVAWIIVNYSSTRVSWCFWLSMTGEEWILPSPSSENNVTVEVGQSNFAETCAFLKAVPTPNLVVIA